MTQNIPGRPRDELAVAQIDGQRYFVSTTPPRQDGTGGRNWSEEHISTQGEASPVQEVVIPLMSFHDGGGFSDQGPESTYSHADGLVADSPGVIVGWPLLASGQTFETTDYRGWMAYLDPYLYVCRGRWVVKYEVENATSWSIIEKHDLGSSIAVAGRPAVWQGKLYVPRINTGSDALQVFHELTTVATTVVEQQTITITGDPTGGSYTLTWQGNTTAAIAWDADAAAVQAALRLLPGAELFTVSSSGTSPNFVHTVVLTGAAAATGNSSPTEMTSTDSLTGGTPGIAHATSVAGTTDTWTAGASGIEARCFTVWEELLVEGEGTNEIRTCATTPTTAANWSPSSAGAGYTVGESGYSITDIGTWGRFLVVMKENGLFTFDEDLQTINRLPDLQYVIDPDSGKGMAAQGDSLYVPHLAGFIRWAPGVYDIVGPNKEGGMDDLVTPGWGRVASVAAFGGTTFWAANDETNAVSSLGAFTGGGARNPAPHFLQQYSGEAIEALAVVTAPGEPITAQYPDTLSDDNAVGTITWANTGNIASADEAYATAAAGTSHYLKALNPDPAVPTDATILGVTVEVLRKAGA